MQSILLTGGLGYVGGRIAIELVRENYKLYCGTRRQNIKSPSWLPTMQMVYLNWSSEKSIQDACNNIDAVIHLAGMNEIESAKDPLGALQSNGFNSLMLLEAAKRSGVKRFIYVSTAHVYGKMEGFIDEKTVPRPIHSYAITHKLAEDYVLAAHYKKNLEGIVVRLSNVFGKPATPDIDRYTLLVNNLCLQAAIQGSLRINDSGNQMRNFITLKDTVNAIKFLLALERNKLSDGLFNLGSRKSETIIKMAKKIAIIYQNITGRSIDIIRPNTNPSIEAPLNYCSDKLLDTGFIWTSEDEDEIAGTLEMCIRSFGRDSN